MPEYRYRVEGLDASGQEWTTVGRIATDNAGSFRDVVVETLRDSFLQVTQGKAVYGHPGTTCRGPYQIVSFTVVQQEVVQ